MVKKVGKKIGETTNRPALNPRRQTILIEITQNPYITKKELSIKLGISETAVDNNIAFLRKNGFIERIGKTKNACSLKFYQAVDILSIDSVYYQLIVTIICHRR